LTPVKKEIAGTKLKISSNLLKVFLKWGILGMIPEEIPEGCEAGKA
jgi:hypothetical protein